MMVQKSQSRIKEVFRSGIMLEFDYAVFICAVLLLFDKQLIGLFGDSKQMLSEGSRYFAVMAFFYWLPGVTNAHQGFLRGVGKMKMTLYGTLTQITFRVIFIIFTCTANRTSRCRICVYCRME